VYLPSWVGISIWFVVLANWESLVQSSRIVPLGAYYLSSVWAYSGSLMVMDYREIQEMHRVLCRHEDFINSNRTSIFSVTTKVHENEHQCISQNAVIMDTLVQQKRQIQVLEVECSMLRNMVCNLSKGSHSAASNYRMSVNLTPDDLKEEETIHQMIEDMDLGNQESHPTNIGQDEALSKHVFH
jgi:hypothetical protein